MKARLTRHGPGRPSYDRGPNELAQSLMYDAMDRLIFSSTQWNYTASNRNDATSATAESGRPLNLFQQSAGPVPRSGFGGRAVKGFSRPYARRIQGEPRLIWFDGTTATFNLVFEADLTISAPTEIFVSPSHYPKGAKLTAEGCGVYGAAPLPTSPPDEMGLVPNDANIQPP